MNNESNDIVYYELKRFVDLLCKNNPNILELLATPDDSILFKHVLMNEIKPELFLSRLCQLTFAGYAQAQIKKARGLNKKISKPMDKERKSILDFCFVIQGQGTISLKDWLKTNEYKQEECGLVNIPHMRDVYAIYHQSQDAQNRFKGICSGDYANDVQLSSVSKGINPLVTMSFNKDGYSVYCKEFKGYWEWKGKRNENRYQNTIEHGKNYDAKNMMHVFRLLNMAEEIALYKKINVRRHDRDFLLKIRNGEFMYDELVNQANEKTERIVELFAKSDLPEIPDNIKVQRLLVRIRELLYEIGK